MSIVRPLLVIILMLGAPTAHADPSSSTTVPRRVDADKSCQQLYLEITALLELRYATEAGFWNDQKNQVASVTGNFFKPAWFYLGYAAVRHLHAQEGSFDARKRIAELRTASADKMCFVD